MTAYGIPRNNFPKTLEEFRKLTHPTWEQVDAEKIVKFIEEQTPERRQYHSDFVKRERKFAADAARNDIENIIRVNKYDNRRFGWEPRPTGWPKEEVPDFPAWHQRATNPRWYVRLYRRLRYRNQVTTVAEMFDDWCRDEETWERRHPGRPFRYGS